MSPQRILTCLLMAFGISIGSALVAAQTRDIPSTIGDLNSAQLVEVRDRSGKVLLNGTLKTESTKATEIEREADLVSPDGGKGEGDLDVEIERKEKNGVVETTDEIELEVKHLPGITECDLFIDGVRVASFVTSKSGKGGVELERKTTGQRQ